jgi:hypothetical protein
MMKRLFGIKSTLTLNVDQPLMRDALTRFADSEIKIILIKLAEEAKLQQQQDSQAAANSIPHKDEEHLKAA